MPAPRAFQHAHMKREGFFDVVPIRKWRIAVQVKAAPISHLQAQQDHAEDCEERERRHEPKDAASGWTLSVPDAEPVRAISSVSPRSQF